MSIIELTIIVHIKKNMFYGYIYDISTTFIKDKPFSRNYIKFDYGLLESNVV
jgi:hypothetical protein